MKNARILTTVIIVIGIAIVATVVAAKLTNAPTASTPPVICTADARLCPDGSYVARTGPNCEFSKCPTGNGGTGVVPPTSGIIGTVLLGPTCPVMRNPPDPQCADKPYQTSLEVTTADGSKVVARFSSDAQGKFKVTMPMGNYVIRSASTNSPFPRCSSNGTVNVGVKGFTEANVYCDTGIR